ncbi:hypothetical protein Hanom_Chr00s000001g01593651 [Helianthus anomalus]
MNSSVELISHQPSPLANLESLRLLPNSYDLWHIRFFVSVEVKSYLLSRSPKATLIEVFTLVYYMIMKINALLKRKHKIMT